jgi:septum formation protein
VSGPDQTRPRLEAALPLVLASSSPRRAELLSRLGLSFQVLPPQVSEDTLESETPREHVERLSREKAGEVSKRCPGALVLAGDTVVVLEGTVLGKPRDENDAVRMLKSLSGRTHIVVSGVAISLPAGNVFSGSAETRVTFRVFDEELARRYVETGEPMDKAGAYGIQGLGSALIRGIRGDYSNVMGLPLPLFLDLLEEAGWQYMFGTISPRSGSAD